MENTTFEQVLEDNKKQIFRICRIYAVAPLEPEDLFQEVTVRIWQAYSTFKGNSSVSTWVYRIALNVCISSKNKQTKNASRTVQLDSIRFEPAASIPAAAQQQKYSALYSCIQQLAAIDQSIIILSLEALSYKEISGITGLTENHIAVKMKRARKLLLDCITFKIKRDE